MAHDTAFAGKRQGWPAGGPAGGRRTSYSGAIDVRPQSAHFRYSTGNDSDRPMIRAPATPHRGQRTAGVGRLAMLLKLLWILDAAEGRSAVHRPSARRQGGYSRAELPIQVGAAGRVVWDTQGHEARPADRDPGHSPARKPTAALVPPTGATGGAADAATRMDTILPRIDRTRWPMRQEAHLWRPRCRDRGPNRAQRSPDARAVTRRITSAQPCRCAHHSAADPPTPIPVSAGDAPASSRTRTASV